jgi:DUF438 domain-containing protein
MNKDDAVCRAILDDLPEQMVFVDTAHIIRYMNRKAAEHYKKRGGYGLVGQSIMDCHNENSCRIIREVFARMRDEGVDEEKIYERPGKVVYMRAVRDGDGKLLGYYERYQAADKACNRKITE